MSASPNKFVDDAGATPPARTGTAAGALGVTAVSGTSTEDATANANNSSARSPIRLRLRPREGGVASTSGNAGGSPKRRSKRDRSPRPGKENDLASNGKKSSPVKKVFTFAAATAGALSGAAGVGPAPVAVPAPVAAPAVNAVSTLGPLDLLPGGDGPVSGVVAGLPTAVKLFRGVGTAPERAVSLAKSVLDSGHLKVWMLSETVLGSAQMVWNEIRTMYMDQHKLFYLHNAGNNQLSSGYSNAHCIKDLLEMETINWKAIFRHIGDLGYKITSAHIKMFLKGGKHSLHPDGWYPGKGSHRMIISLCCFGKEFWMKKGNAGAFGIGLLHGTATIISQYAAGTTENSEWKHGAFGEVAGSVVAVFDLEKLKAA